MDIKRLVVLCHGKQADADASAICTAALSLMGADALPHALGELVQEVGDDPERAAAALVTLSANVVTLLIVAGEALGQAPEEMLQTLALSGQR